MRTQIFEKSLGNPLAPAKAGIQVISGLDQDRTGTRWLNLGPGLRRDERNCSCYCGCFAFQVLSYISIALFGVELYQL